MVETDNYTEYLPDILLFVAGMLSASMVYTFYLVGEANLMEFLASGTLFGFWRPPEFWLPVQGVLLLVSLAGYLYFRGRE